MLRIEWANQAFELLPEKAVHWPARQALIVADTHFGKADHFRQAGIPVPWGTTDASLLRLGNVLATTGARRLIVLGDLFHARTGLSEAMLERLHTWRSERRALEVLAVRGNHDRHAGDPPAALGVRVVGDVWEEEGITFQHEPAAQANGAYTMAGHLHPAVALHGAGRAGMRLPCFWFGERSAVLPAFGAFTGMRAIRPRRGDRVFAIGPDTVVQVTGPT